MVRGPYSFTRAQFAAVAAEDIDPLRRRTGVEKMIDGERVILDTKWGLPRWC